MRTHSLKNIWFAMVALILLACQDIKDQPTFRPPSFDFEEVDIRQIQKGYEDGLFTVTLVVKRCLDRIARLDKNGPELNAILQLNPDALVIAAELDRERESGISRGPLHGIPVVLKDNIDTHDKMATTAGSRALTDSHPLHDSWVAKRLREEGAVILGKANSANGPTSIAAFLPVDGVH